MSENPEIDIARAVVDSPSFSAVARQLAAEKASRQHNEGVSDVLTLDDSLVRNTHRAIAPGTMVIVVTGDPQLSQSLRQQITSGDYDSLDAAVTDIINDFRRLNRSHYDSRPPDIRAA